MDKFKFYKKIMKKIVSVLAAAFIFTSVMANDKPFEHSKLPQSAKSFVTSHFGGVKVISTMVDDDFIRPDYTVYFDGGAKVEFKNSGAWKEVSGGNSEIPSSIVPAKILQYVKSNLGDHKIVKIEVDRNDYEIRLANGVEASFSLNGDFMGIDD